MVYILNNNDKLLSIKNNEFTKIINFILIVEIVRYTIQI